MRKNSVHQSSVNGTCFQWHGDTGPVVVLIHGLGLNRHMWQWQLEALSQSYQVLSYDLIGHGDTPSTDKPQSLTMFAEQLFQLLAEVQVETCSIVGFSLGGMIARRFAMDYPDSLNALVILNSPHARSSAQQQAIVQRVNQVAQQGPASTVDAALERWFTDDFQKTNAALINLVRGWVLANDNDSYPGSYRVLAMGVDELVSPSPAISCPTLVITAEDDFGQPASMAYAIAAEIPNSKVNIIPGLRHMALVEAPEVYNQLLLEFFVKTMSCSS